jgi:single-strand DNA-binding protein
MMKPHSRTIRANEKENEVNAVNITGKLCRGGELKTLESGKQIYKGTLAYWNSYKKDTEFYRFVIFGKQGYYFSEWAEDGDPIGLTGRLSTSKWVDKQSGMERRDISIAVNEFDILKPREKKNEASPDDGRPDNEDYPDGPDDGKLPF